MKTESYRTLGVALSSVSVHVALLLAATFLARDGRTTEARPPLVEWMDVDLAPSGGDLASQGARVEIAPSAGALDRAATPPTPAPPTEPAPADAKAPPPAPPPADKEPTRDAKAPPTEAKTLPDAKIPPVDPSDPGARTPPDPPRPSDTKPAPRPDTPPGDRPIQPAPGGPAAPTASGAASSGLGGRGPEGPGQGEGPPGPGAGTSPQYRARVSSWFQARVSLGASGSTDPHPTLRVGVAVTLSGRRVAGFAVTRPSGDGPFDARIQRRLQNIVSSGAELPEPDEGATIPTQLTLSFTCKPTERCS